MWKNGDHTQVFSIIEIEMPFSLNAFTKPSAKSQSAAGLVLFKKVADGWKKVRTSYDLVNHWENSKLVANNYEIFNNVSKQIEYETCLEESIKDSENGLEGRSVVQPGLWEIIVEKIEDEKVPNGVDNLVIWDDIELLGINQEKEDEDDLVIIEESDRIQSTVDSGSGTSSDV